MNDIIMVILFTIVIFQSLLLLYMWILIKLEKEIVIHNFPPKNKVPLDQITPRPSKTRGDLKSTDIHEWINITNRSHPQDMKVFQCACCKAKRFELNSEVNEGI